MDATILKAFFLLAVCVGGIGVLFYFLKKYSSKINKNSSTTELKVVGKLSLMPKSHLFIVKVGNRDLLLGVTEGSINTLAELNQAMPTYQANPIEQIETEQILQKHNFSQLLEIEEQNPVAKEYSQPSNQFGDSKIDKVAAKLKKEPHFGLEPEKSSQDLSFKSFIKSITKVG